LHRLRTWQVVGDGLSSARGYSTPSSSARMFSRRLRADLIYSGAQLTSLPPCLQTSEARRVDVATWHGHHAAQMLHELHACHPRRIFSFLIVAALSILFFSLLTHSKHARHHWHSRTNVRRGITFSPSFPPLPHSLLLLLPRTTSKLLSSYTFLAHTALSDARKIFITMSGTL
jgi:hypothetical protein